jgi:hypothetical protein
MNKIKLIIKLSTLILLIFTIFFIGCKKTKPEPTPYASVTVPKNNIAYIYKKNNEDGLAFKELLEDNDCHVTLIDKAQVANTTFTAYQLIVIDNNTDIGGLKSSWKEAETLAIESSGKQMLLIGIGGLQYANKIGNVVNYTRTIFFADNKFFVTDKTSTLYTSPFEISIPASSPAVTLYDSPMPSAGLEVPSGCIIANVALVGRFSNDPNYFPASFEKNRYFCFGFSRGVDDMNESGKNFMVNLAYYVGNLSL